MDYKEKYENALKRAKEIYYHPNASLIRKEWIEEIFPELVENEDEKIRKELMEISNTVLKRQGTTLFGKNYDYKKMDCLA